MKSSRCILELNFDEFRELDLSDFGKEDEIQAQRLQYWMFHWRGHFDCWNKCDSKWNFGNDEHDVGYFCHECNVWHKSSEVFSK